MKQYEAVIETLVEFEEVREVINRPLGRFRS